MTKTNLVLGMMMAGATALASADSLFVDANGNVGVGTTGTSVSKRLLVSGVDNTGANTDNKIALKVENLSTTPSPLGRVLAELVSYGNTKFQFSNKQTGVDWAFANGDKGDFRISKQGTGGPEFILLGNGNLTIKGALTEGSDRNIKTNINPVDNNSILEKVANLPISSWSYKSEPSVTHVGPMAQDFYASFGLGKTDKGIATIDSSGIALAAIKALNERLNERDAKIAYLEQQLQKQQLVLDRVDALEALTVEFIGRNGGAQGLKSASYNYR